MNLKTYNVDPKVIAASLLTLGLAVSPSTQIFASSVKAVAQVQQQQNIKVSGTVKDADGVIVGASIVEKGAKNNGTITDMDGKFSINVRPGATLVITYMGCKPVEVKAVAGKTLNVTMDQDSELLNEVAVVGFGTQKKVNLTGAVDVVDSKQLASRPVANAVQALQGAAPGLQITQTSGSVDSRPSINVRGGTTIGNGSNGDPLVLIDGIEADLNSINPQDIESVSILKDAAASSIYGSRAPFGVILVTTKSGKEGKSTINYNNNFRIGVPNVKNHLMHSVQFASWMNDAFVNNGQNPYFQTNADGTGRFDKIVEYANATPVRPGVRVTADGKEVYEVLGFNSAGQWLGGYSNGVADTDWYDILYKDNTFSQQHNLSASGGTSKFKYYLSGSFFDQNGLLKVGNEDLKRYTGTAKIDAQLTNWLNIHYNMRFTREDSDKPTRGGWYEAVALRGWPVLPAYDWNGNKFYSDTACLWSWEDGGQTQYQTDNIYHQLGFIVEPVKNWKTYVDFNYRINNVEGHNWTLPLTATDKNGASYYKDSYSQVQRTNTKENYMNFSAHTDYDFSILTDHHFHLMAGMQAEDFRRSQFGARRQGLMDADKPQIDMTNGLNNGKATTPEVYGSEAEWTVAGFFGRLNYDYKSRYLFEANVRHDGSSRFRRNKRWKTFPSFSLGWNIAEENFMKSTRNWLDMLKLRLSYGSLGNQNVTNWYYTYLTVSANPVGGTWLQNGQKVPTAGSAGLVSESLTWERVKVYNIGLDWALLNNRLTGSFNWYTRKTLDMVGPARELPAILGTGVPLSNNTDLQARGWELTLGWQDRLANGLSYGAKFSLYDSRTKITRYPNATMTFDTYVPGRYTGEIWGFETIGIAKTDKEMQDHLATLPNGGQDAIGSKWAAGDIMYKDLNNDGKVSWGSSTIADPGDRKVIGNSTPRYQFGFDTNASWKGFDLRLFFQGVMKRDYWQGSQFMFGYTGDQWNCAGLTQMQDYFRDENTWSVKQGTMTVNTNSYLPRPLQGDSKNLKIQTRYLQDASYIRLKNLTLGYTLPATLTSKWGISNLRVYFSGENLWTGTSLNKQFDPETISSNGGAAYPLSKTYSFGLSVTF